MKEKNMNLKMFFIALLFVIMPLILFNNNYALELNEEYVKEDFEIVENDKNEKMFVGLTESGIEKCKKNNGVLVIDGNVVEEFKIYVWWAEEYVKEIYLKNLEKLEETDVIGGDALEKIHFEGCSNLYIINNVVNNSKLKDIDMYSLKSLKVLGYSDEYSDLPGAYVNYLCNNNLSNVRLNPELEVIGDDAFGTNTNLKDLDISYLKNLKKVSDVAFVGNNTRLHVAYKNPLGLKDAEKIYKEDNNYNLYSSSFNNGQPINGHVIVDDVQNKLDEVTEDKKLAEITNEDQAKLDEVKDIIKKQFANEEELNSWLKEKGFTERENKIIEDNNLLGEKIDAKLEEIRNLEPYAKTNEELLKELDEVAKEVEEYNKKYDELYNVYIEEIKELLVKQKSEVDKANGEKDDLNKKLEDLQAEKEKTDKLNEDTIKNLNELIDKLNKEIEANKNKIKELENNIKDLQEEKTKVEAEKAMLENTLAETKDKLKAAEKNNDKASEEIMNLKNKISELEEKLAKCKEHCKKLEEELNNTKADLKNEQEENAKLNEKIKKIEAEKAELVSKNKELMEKEEERKKQEELEKSKEELEKQKEEREKRQQELKEEREKEELENNSSVTTNTKSTNKKYTKSNNKLPYAGSESVIILSLITIGAIIYTRRVMKRK